MEASVCVLSGRFVKCYGEYGFKTLVIGRDLEHPYAFTYPEYTDRLRGNNQVVGVEETDLKHHITKRQVVRFSCESPGDVATIRDRVVGYDLTFEADIPYLRRLFVDRQLIVKHHPRAVVFVDIEVDDSKGMPKPGKSQILSIAYAFYGDGRVNWMYVGDYGSESRMLSEFRQILEASGVGAIVGWNVKFDYSFLSERGKITHMAQVDMLELYKSEVKGLESYSLENVVRHEGLGTKTRSKRVCEMTRQELMDYNTADVSYLVELEKKYGFVGLQLRISEIVGLPLDMLTPVKIGDTLILRRARELGYVLSNSVRSERKSYPGAVVLEPRARGLVRNVAVFDYESLYPNIIINERVDIPGFSGEVLPYIEGELIRLRKEAKKKHKETGDVRYDIEQKAYKILANSLYGLFGTVGFRFYDINKASFITGKGREMLLKMVGEIEDMGYRVVYGDTDSVFVVGWETPDELVFLEASLNELLKPYRVKLEYYGDVYLITKKRYIFRTHDGRQVVKGVELVRGDWARLFKDVVASVVSMLFEGKGIAEISQFLSQVKKELFEGRLDDKLVICKSYTPGKKYKVMAEHVKAVKRLVQKGIPEETITEVCYVYAKNTDGVEPILNGRVAGKIDYQRYWERVLQLVGRIVVRNASKI